MRAGLCPLQQMRPAEPLRSLRRAISISLPIVVALILLPVIAFASPPDPSWIAGIYDGADGDDIVTLVYETAAANAAAKSHIVPLPCLPEIRLESFARGVPGSRITRSPRAPPGLSSTVVAHVFSFSPDDTSIASGTAAPLPCTSITKFHLSRRGDLNFFTGRQNPSWMRPSDKRGAPRTSIPAFRTVSGLGRDPPGLRTHRVSSTL